MTSGLANRVFTAEGHRRYEVRTVQHHHIYCTQTNEISDYYDAALDQWIQQYFSSKNIENFRIQQVHVQISGYKIDPDKEVHEN